MKSRLTHWLVRFLRLDREPQLDPQLFASDPNQSSVDLHLKAPLQTHSKDSPLMVPDSVAMEVLMRHASHIASKANCKEEPIRVRYPKKVRQYVDEVFCDESIAEDYVFLKALALEAISELVSLHSQRAHNCIQNQEVDAAISWLQDSGALMAASSLIRRVVINHSDWMARPSF